MSDTRFEGEGMTEFTMRRIRNEIIEECAGVALEQRCERGTPWDLACTMIAEKIRAMAITSRDGS